MACRERIGRLHATGGVACPRRNWPDRPTAPRGRVDQFNETNDGAIYANMSTVFSQYDKVLTAIAGGNPPDVVSAVWLHQLVSMAAATASSP